jgi:hypothetical protein
MKCDMCKKAIIPSKNVFYIIESTKEVVCLTCCERNDLIDE